MAADFAIHPVEGAVDLAAVHTLFRAYQSELEVDLAYQDFASELASLPGDYALPRGSLLLAHNELGEPIGCVAMRPTAQPGRCEMKRLFVAPAGRGSGLGRALVEALIEQAKRLDYGRMCLDTLPSMTAAQGLYRDIGFEPIAAYCSTALEGTVFLELDLREPASNGPVPRSA